MLKAPFLSPSLLVSGAIPLPSRIFYFPRVPVHPPRHASQNLYIGPLITEKKLAKAQQASPVEAEKAKKVDESKNVEEAERTDASEEDKEEEEGDEKTRDKEGIAVAMEGIALAGRAELDRADSAGAV